MSLRLKRFEKALLLCWGSLDQWPPCETLNMMGERHYRVDLEGMGHDASGRYTMEKYWKGMMAKSLPYSKLFLEGSEDKLP